MKLPLFALDHWFATAEGRFDLSLSHSACEIQSAADFLDENELKSFAETPLDYGPFDGLPELQSVIADQYKSINPKHVLTFNGPSEAIYTFMQATLEPGDQIVVQSPLFHSQWKNMSGLRRTKRWRFMSHRSRATLQSASARRTPLVLAVTLMRAPFTR